MIIVIITTIIINLIIIIIIINNTIIVTIIIMTSIGSLAGFSFASMFVLHVSRPHGDDDDGNDHNVDDDHDDDCECFRLPMVTTRSSLLPTILSLRYELLFHADSCHDHSYLTHKRFVNCRHYHSYRTHKRHYDYLGPSSLLLYSIDHRPCR
jgi:hypothetical protein